MAADINQHVDDDSTITIYVYGHAGAGEKAPLAGQRAAAVAKLLTKTLDAKIVVVANQTAGADGRKAEVVFTRHVPFKLAMPTRPPVD